MGQNAPVLHGALGLADAGFTVPIAWADSWWLTERARPESDTLPSGTWKQPG